MNKIITAALPYANGRVHIGSLVEYIQVDIYVRFLKLIGQEALYICASDMHGTPIEVNASKQGKKPKEFALENHKANLATFKKYLIEFDNYHHTDSKENKELAEYFFNKLKEKGFIYKKEMEIVFCEDCDRSLPDRFVKGTCPNCGTFDQYGDVCESCNLTLKGVDLINPKCSICQATPIKKDSEHYFFKLSKFGDKIKKWMVKAELQPEIKNSVKEWLDKGLEDWCISRDGPYYGFKIPGEKDKYFYVWLDAPIGYISSTKNYCDREKLKWEEVWRKSEVTHVIGKDIIYFHYLFWPAMLMAAGFDAPDNMLVHGFLTINGQKMSKSRGTYFSGEDFLKLYNPEALRFYYANHLSKKLADIDLDFENFKDSVNNRLVANLGNFGYRTLSFAQKNYGGDIVRSSEKKLEKEILELVEEIGKNYADFNFKEAMAGILRISDLGNVYFQKAEPWVNPSEKQKQVSWCVNLIKNLAILIKPVLPEFSLEVEKTLGLKELSWKDINFDFVGKISKPKILIQKIEKVPESAVFPLDLKVGKIIDVNDHPNADSLYLMKVDFGNEKRQVVAGLKKYFETAELIGKKAVFVVNLKPAKLRGEKSEAMILAAGDGKNVSVLEVEKSSVGSSVSFEGYDNNTKQITFDDFVKIKMKVKNKQVIYETKHLKTDVEDVVVKGIKDGGKVS